VQADRELVLARLAWVALGVLARAASGREVDAAYIRLRATTVASTEEIKPGVMMDVGADGRPVGFEILDASDLVDSSDLFLDGQPRGMKVKLPSIALTELLSKALTDKRPRVAS